MDRDVHDKFRELSGQISDLADSVQSFGKRLEKSKEGELDKHEIMVEIEELKARLTKTEKVKTAVKKRVVKKKKATTKTTNE